MPCYQLILLFLFFFCLKLQEGNQGYRGGYAQDGSSQGYGAGPGRRVDWP